jgi:ribosome modulation factor
VSQALRATSRICSHRASGRDMLCVSLKYSEATSPTPLPFAQSSRIQEKSLRLVFRTRATCPYPALRASSSIRSRRASGRDMLCVSLKYSEATSLTPLPFAQSSRIQEKSLRLVNRTRSTCPYQALRARTDQRVNPTHFSGTNCLS